MEFSENGKKRYDFLNLDLENTDPDLANIFANFALDEVLEYVSLDIKTIFMVIIPSLITNNSKDLYKVALNVTLKKEILSSIEIKEILYQSSAYIGIGKMFDFINITNEVLKEHNIFLPLKSGSTTTLYTRFEKGLAKQKEIFGDETIQNMINNSPEDEKFIQTFLSANCFGDYYTRLGLDNKQRELITFSILITIGSLEPQVKAHILGNLNVGNNKNTLMDIVAVLVYYIGYPKALNAIRCIKEVCK